MRFNSRYLSTYSVIINGLTISGSFYPVWQQYQETLGNPTGNVLSHESGATYQIFENGSIVSSQHGTLPLYGAIRQAYLGTGGLNGDLGAPTSAEIGLGNGVIKQTFENGYIQWNGYEAEVYRTGDPQPNVQPPDNTPIIGGEMYQNIGAFFAWAEGQVGIAALDDRDPNLNGQCVTLIARYMAEVFFPASERNATVRLDHGRGVAEKVANNYSQYFEPLTDEGLPKIGAVISFPTIGGGYGHVVIVTDARQLENGERQVKIIDSNSDSQGVNSTVVSHDYWINIPDGRANNYGTDIVWTNPR